MERLACEYVRPLRWYGGEDVEELRAYLLLLRQWADVTVVDGSEAHLYARHARAWGGLVRHVPPQPWPGANGKVGGVVTGVRLACHERVVIADDDVRYDAWTLRRVVDRLADADLVRPQNVYDELPWQARWDTGRLLLNRALGHDHPGTLAVRRSGFLAMGGYDGDVLFENLELVRTVAAAGGAVADAPDLFVTRHPPQTSRFWEQRVRQAYDDFAQPARLAAELALLPLLAVTAARRPVALPALAAAAVGIGEVGRRRAGGRTRFAPTAAFWTLPWLLERSVTVWVALAMRVRGGVPYAGGRFRVAAHSPRQLRRRLSRHHPRHCPQGGIRTRSRPVSRHLRSDVEGRRAPGADLGGS